MSVFGNYAGYYDLLYHDKDYAGEALFIDMLLQGYGTNTQSILELGCGTGTHGILLAKQGYEVQGIDLSEEMLRCAYERLSDVSEEIASRVKFCCLDIRTGRLNKQFDAVISLFHVVSYQTTNEDLRATFATVKAHLKPGGIFIFDCWYGPAVLTDRPTVRVKRLEDDKIAVTRIAEPVLSANENCVDVNYQVFIQDKNSGEVEELWETHRMRYLFNTEVELLFSEFDFELVECREWMSQDVADFNTWFVYFIARVGDIVKDE